MPAATRTKTPPPLHRGMGKSNGEPLFTPDPSASHVVRRDRTGGFPFAGKLSTKTAIRTSSDLWFYWGKRMIYRPWQKGCVNYLYSPA